MNIYIKLPVQIGWLKSLSVNHTVYLDYGFMATSEPQKYVINKIPVLLKGSLQNLDSGLDWTLDWTMDSGLDYGLTVL